MVVQAATQLRAERHAAVSVVDADERERDEVRRSQRGDADAFALLVQRHQAGIYNLLLRMTRNTEDATDLAQETFLRAWRGLPGFRAEAKFRTWLYRIAYNVCLSRRILPPTVADADATDALPLPERDEPPFVVERQEERQRVAVAVEHLAPQYRLVLHLYYWREFSYDEIAGVLNLPIGTVKTHLFRAKAALRTALIAGDDAR